MLLAVIDFIGRFHPVVVHLPIGILLLAAFFQLFSRRYQALKPAIPVIVFWGAAGAIISCLTGYLLSRSGEYDPSVTATHQWMGIITALVAVGYYVLLKGGLAEKTGNILAIALILLITLTGHLGGSLTHGADYLTGGLTGSGSQGLKPIPNVQEAVIYTDIVQPILEQKCYSCHGSNRQKGKLRLDTPDYLMAGGESGKVVEAGKVDDSELIRRLLLPLSNDEHMPPKEKPQLTTVEIQLLSWWVSSGADFGKKVNETPQPESIKPILKALETGTVGDEKENIPDIPVDEIGPADEKALKALREVGAVVLPTAMDNNYLTVSFITAGKAIDNRLRLLEPIKKQLVWLKLDDSDLSDAGMEQLAVLSNLTRLSLVNTGITDKGIAHLSALKNLQVLNLVNTRVTEKGLLNLKDLRQLRAIYLYRTGVDRSQWEELKSAFPQTLLDSGGYQVPTLPSDTTLVTP